MFFVFSGYGFYTLRRYSLLAFTFSYCFSLLIVCIINCGLVAEFLVFTSVFMLYYLHFWFVLGTLICACLILEARSSKQLFVQLLLVHVVCFCSWVALLAIDPVLAHNENCSLLTKEKVEALTCFPWTFQFNGSTFLVFLCYVELLWGSLNVPFIIVRLRMLVCGVSTACCSGGPGFDSRGRQADSAFNFSRIGQLNRSQCTVGDHYGSLRF
jgi:hypothetical protein